MKCPACSGEMAPVTYADVEVDRCVQCGGLWFDAMEMDKLREIRHSEIIDTGKTEGWIDSAEHAHPRICPKCHTRMIQMVVQDKPHIEYESCTVCFGSFFDAGEFAEAKEGPLFKRIMDLISG